MTETYDAATDEYVFSFRLPAMHHDSYGVADVTQHFKDMSKQHCDQVCASKLRRLSLKAMTDGFALPAGTAYELVAWGEAQGHL